MVKMAKIAKDFMENLVRHFKPFFNIIFHHLQKSSKAVKQLIATFLDVLEYSEQNLFFEILHFMPRFLLSKFLKPFLEIFLIAVLKRSE